MCDPRHLAALAAGLGAAASALGESEAVAKVDPRNIALGQGRIPPAARPLGIIPDIPPERMPGLLR